MSGQKRLEKACRNNRVVAVPSKKRTDYVLDENGQQMYDKKTGEPLTKQTQLYNIVTMRYTCQRAKRGRTAFSGHRSGDSPHLPLPSRLG